MTDYIKIIVGGLLAYIIFMVWCQVEVWNNQKVWWNR